MSDAQLANLIARTFIQRPSPAAVQTGQGGYMPLRDKEAGTETRFTQQMLLDHLDGRKTYGHYMLDSEDMCKLFVIDIDLATGGFVPTIMLDIATSAEGSTEDLTPNFEEWVRSFVYTPDLRGVWHDRSNLPARQYIKHQMLMLSHLFCAHISTYLGIHSAAAYSGNKGVHVYGFTGELGGQEAYEYAELMIGVPGYWDEYRGKSFYRDSRHKQHLDPTKKAADQHIELDFSTFDPSHYFNFHIEKFPKQPSLQGKDLGNLVRLPLGRNMHHPVDPTFFIDLRNDFHTMKPLDPIEALTGKNPYEK